MATVALRSGYSRYAQGCVANALQPLASLAVACARGAGCGIQTQSRETNALQQRSNRVDQRKKPVFVANEQSTPRMYHGQRPSQYLPGRTTTPTASCTVSSHMCKHDTPTACSLWPRSRWPRDALTSPVRRCGSRRRARGMLRRVDMHGRAIALVQGSLANVRSMPCRSCIVARQSANELPFFAVMSSHASVYPCLLANAA